MRKCFVVSVSLLLLAIGSSLALADEPSLTSDETAPSVSTPAPATATGESLDTPQPEPVRDLAYYQNLSELDGIADSGDQQKDCPALPSVPNQQTIIDVCEGLTRGSSTTSDIKRGLSVLALGLSDDSILGQAVNKTIPLMEANMTLFPGMQSALSCQAVAKHAANIQVTITQTRTACGLLTKSIDILGVGKNALKNIPSFETEYPDLSQKFMGGIEAGIKGSTSMRSLLQCQQIEAHDRCEAGK